MNESSRLIRFNKQSNKNSVRHLKDSEAGLIPLDWEIGRVKDYFTLGRGRVISKSYIRENSGPFPVFSSQSFNNGEMGKIDTYDFDGSYLTWTTDGAYAGSVFFREGKFNCTNVCGTCLAKEPSVVDTKYAAYYLESKAKKYVSYVGNPKLMNNIFAEIPIVLPPLSEQKKIAEIISRIDKYINLLEFKLIKMQHLYKSILDKNLNNRKGSEIQLSQIASLQSGGTPSRNNENFWRGSIPWVKTGEVNYKDIITTEESISEEGLKHSSAKIMPVGTILMAMYGQGVTRGRVARLSIPAATNQACLGINSKSENYLNDYIYFCLCAKYNELRSFVQEGSQKNLSKTIVGQIFLPDLNFHEQIDIVKICKCIEDILQKLCLEISRSKFLKQSISQDLLSGKKE